MDKQTFSRYDVLLRQTDSAKGNVVMGVFQWAMTHLAPSTQCAVQCAVWIYSYRNSQIIILNV